MTGGFFMPTLAILLLLTGATLHTAWNLVIKQAQEKYIVTWWVVVIGGLASLVALAFTGMPPRNLWGFAFFSVLVEAAYFLALSYAYHDHDFSLVYPIARGAAPAFLAVWAFLFLAEAPTGGGLVGLCLIIGGLVVIGASALLKRGVGRVHFQGVVAALALAFLISTYTAIDGAAVKQGPAMPYAFLIFALVPLPLTPFVLRQYGWTRLKETWEAQRLRLSAAGVLGVAAYLLALAAYSIAPLNYSGAIREVSVVIGAFAGWRILGERLGPVRLAGAAIIFAGILVIARWG
jgi:drug/metabolite transporter (DMT)-like permease